VEIVMRSRATFAACGLLIAALGLLNRPAHADAGWFESGDTLLRADLQLLNDAEVIRLPVSQWPMPRAAVRHAIEQARTHLATNAAVIAALARVRQRAELPGAPLAYGVSASGGDPGLLRDFDPVAREKGELGAHASYDAGRVAVSLDVTGALSPADGQHLRVDGSHATVQLGNWLLSANTLDRWWGPSHESSLILSNNARPMPTVTVERATALPFESRWLRWLGPWRLSFGISEMESDRRDIDSPLFMAWRVVVMPFKDIELGFSRTAQFCGRQLQCSLTTFKNLLIGNDNVGIDATPANEPGNQMAGFDMRWSSPIGSGPYAIYSQMIGEDEADFMPVKYLMQLGAEVWKPLARGGLVQVFAEYTSTTCSANTSRGPYYNCSYNQGRFNSEGYRYRGRVIGYTSDTDAENYAVGAIYSTAAGELWSATARTARLNRDAPESRNSVTTATADYRALELGWKGSLFGEHVQMDLGIESLQPVGGEREVEPFGFVGWRHEFAP
jgi:hypothetical protein